MAEVVCFMVIIVLVVQLVRYRLEFRHLKQQLSCLEKGSHMELTANIRNRTVLGLYQKVNKVLEQDREKECQYKHAQKQLKQTISNIAHDIRTPLTSALGYLQMLQECDDGKSRSRYEKIIEKRLEELKEMLEELFLYTKLTNREYEIQCQTTAVFPILSECLIGLYQKFEEKGVEPEIHFEKEELHIWGNEDALGRVFRNLVNNALLHGAGGLTVEQQGNAITYSNPLAPGQIIDPEQIFERFYKEDSSRQKGSSGLGLAIVKELVRRMGGDVRAEVSNGQVHITLFMKPYEISEKE